MAAVHAIIFHVLLPLTFFITTTGAITAATKPRRLVTRLHHRDSIYYNTNETNYDRAKRILNISIPRLIYVSHKYSSETYNAHAIQPSLFLSSKNSLFYVNFSIGQPPVPQLAYMDTGSYLIWVNCNATCQKCGTPIFDTSKSSSFVKSSCHNTFCNGCSPNNECMFKLKYIKGPDSDGIIATEQFSFESSDEGIITTNNILFGCALNNSGELGKSNGVFGLGFLGNRFSILKHLGTTKFSYCIGSAIDHEYKYNRLVLGEGAVIEGSSTPFEIIANAYYLNLDGISVGSKRLEIDPNIFKRSSSTQDHHHYVYTGVIIDSGSAITWLAPIAYQTIAKEIEVLAQGLLTKTRFEGQLEWQLCYSGDVSRDLHGFPAMTFHFSKEADLVVDVLGMFYQLEPSTVFCLAFGPSDYHGQYLKNFSAIGMMAQQEYNVAYDIAQNMLYFQRIDCQLLDD